MDAGIGRLSAFLAEPEESISSELIDRINRNIGPPSPLGEADVYIRAMYIVSDEVNSFGGRFPPEEHQQICRLLIDSPVMVGHRKDRLPIGRSFHATVVEKDGRQWVKSYFYWLKNAAGAETLRENIDGGIYKECSIGFTFFLPECSLCGQDIRLCPHEPLKTYPQDGREITCHFNYRQINRVLETSLVYRGALPDTAVSRELGREEPPVKTNRDLSSVKRPSIKSPLELDPSCIYTVTPAYDALLVAVHSGPNGVRIVDETGRTVDDRIARRFAGAGLPELNGAVGYLIGLRGKERCSVSQVNRFLNGRSSPVTRLEIRLLPADDLHLPPPATAPGRYSISLIRYRATDVAALDRAAAELATRDGVHVWPNTQTPHDSVRYSYHPPQPRRLPSEKAVTLRFYTLQEATETGRARLCVTSEQRVDRFDIWQFSHALLAKGGRFIADRLTEDTLATPQAGAATCGPVAEMIAKNGGLQVSLSGKLAGTYVMRPITLKGRDRYLFYRVRAENTASRRRS